MTLLSLHNFPERKRYNPMQSFIREESSKRYQNLNQENGYDKRLPDIQNTKIGLA
jgi:hypothetical protein